MLTRLPAPHRAPAELVSTFLDDRFGADHLALDAPGHRTLVATLINAGVSGGAAYDGLIAVVAAQHGATLLTLDRRATTTYERLGTPFCLLAGARSKPW